MYAMIRRHHVQADSVDEVFRRARETLLPRIKDTPGLVAFYSVNAGGGVVFSINIFETQEQAEQSNRKAAEWAEENWSSFHVLPPELIAGEVMLHATR
jgi:hypothetical protein